MSNDAPADSVAPLKAARQLQKKGELTQAAAVLSSALADFPTDEKLLQALFSVRIAQNDWEAAVETAHALIASAPDNPDHHFSLGKACAWKGEAAAATAAYRAGLALRHDAPFERIISRVTDAFPPEVVPKRSTYEFSGGAHNLGSIVHETADSALITKISPVRATTTRELTFYAEDAAHPAHRSIAPRLMHAQEIDGIAYLTIERLAPLKTAPDFKEAVQLAHRIASLGGGTAFARHRNAKASPWQLRPTTVIHRFCEIHNQEQNEYLLNRARQIAALQDEPDAARELIGSVEQLVLENRLHLFLNPAEHYGLVHGDFVLSNMGRDPDSGELLAFDWSAFRHGPRFLNAIHYAAIEWVPYSDLRGEYLFNEEHGGLSNIEQIFALYAYILVQLNRKSDHTFALRMEQFLAPALHDMEERVESFKSSEFGALARKWCAAQDELELAEKLAASFKTLEVANRKLEREISTARNRLERIQRSTSWRITAPLRRIGSALNKLRR